MFVVILNNFVSSLALYLVLKLRSTRWALSKLFFVLIYLVICAVFKIISLINLVRQYNGVDLVKTFWPFCKRHLDKVFVKEHGFVICHEPNLFVQLCPLSLEGKSVIWLAKRVTFANTAEFSFHFWVLQIGRALVFWQLEVVVTWCSLSKLKHFDLASSCRSRRRDSWSVAALLRATFVCIWCGQQRARFVSVLLSVWWNQQFKLYLLPTKSTSWSQNVLRRATVKDLVVRRGFVQNKGSLHHSLLLDQLL